jgi:NAD(P)-dependent dehydrogenase (short-subunit alcohol dehydrogenase family)
MWNLQGKKALITGATGGIGGEIAKLFSAAGATITISGTKEEKLKILKEKDKTIYYITYLGLKYDNIIYKINKQ